MRYWKKVDGQGNTLTVESYSHNLDMPGMREITKIEFDHYIANLPPPPPPTDWAALWAAAVTADDKISVIAKRLGLE